MNKIILLFLATTLSIFSASSIKVSKYDKRMGTVIYNPNDVIVIYAKEGYFTMIEFDEDEQVLDGSTGFNEGWDVKKSGNTAYVTAKPYMSSMAEVEGEKGLFSNTSIIQPNSRDWATNLFIRTNKKVYIVDLRLSSKKANYKIKIKYPNKAEQLKQEKYKKIKREREVKNIKKDLNRVTVPRNWDYYKKVNKGSNKISPNYVYDDGKFTHFGFDRTKNMPAIFLREDDKEFSVNSHTKRVGRYYVKTVHKTGKLFFLRSGRKLVGVLNGGYDVNPNLEYDNTNNPRVKREIR